MIRKRPRNLLRWGGGGRRPGVLLGLFFLLLCGTASAEPRLSLEETAPGEAQPRLRFALSGFFDEELRENLESGLPATLLLRWRLDEVRDSWWDRDLADGHLHFRIYFDILESRYELIDGRGRAIADCGNLDELEAVLGEWRAFPLPLPGPLKDGGRYLLSVEARLEPLPADEIRDLERWLKGDDARGHRGVLGGISGGADRMLRRMKGLGERSAEASLELTPPSP